MAIKKVTMKVTGLTESDRAKLNAAASKAHLSFASWARVRLLELANAGRK